MNKTTKILALILSLVLLCGTVMTGCGEKESSTSDGVTTLKWCVNGFEAEDTPEVLEKMNEILIDKCNVKLELKFLSTDTYDLVLSSGEAYDLICAPDWLGYWGNAEKNAFAEITDEDLQNFAPYVWEHGQNYLFASKLDGVRYGIPSFTEYAPDRCYAARGDLMDKYGIDALDSIEKVEEYLFAVAENEKNMIPYDMPGNSPYLITSMWASDWGWAGVGTLSFSEHVYYRVDDPQRKLFIAAEAPEMVEFTKTIKKWNDKGVFSKSVLSNKKSSIDSFKNGRSALAFVSNPQTCQSMWEELQAAGKEAWNVRFYPVYSKSQRMYNYLNACVAISKTTKNKEASLKAINEFFANEELYQLATYGIKGKHWDMTEDGYFETLDNDSFVRLQLGISYEEAYKYPTKLTFPGNEELVAKIESTRIADPIVNCNTDLTELRNEKLAMTEVYNAYTAARCYGAVDDVEKALDEEVKALKKAGIDKYIKELQKVVDKYVKDNNL